MKKLTALLFALLFSCLVFVRCNKSEDESLVPVDSVNDSETTTEVHTESPAEDPGKEFDINSAFTSDTFKAKASVKLAYNLYLPEDYDESRDYPLLVYLHGERLEGNDNEKPLSEAKSLFSNPYSPAYESIVLIPQCPEGYSWDKDVLKSVYQLSDYVNDTYSTNTKRQYFVGSGIGGDAIWRYMELYHKSVSAVISAGGAGIDIMKYPDGTVVTVGVSKEMMEISTGIVCSSKDKKNVTYSELICEALTNDGCKNVFFKTINDTSESGELNIVSKDDVSVLNWLFEQTRQTEKTVTAKKERGQRPENTEFKSNDNFEFGEFTASNGITLPYRYYLPENYDESKEYPVLMFLHSNGVQGSDNKEHMYLLDPLFADADSPVYESIVVAPHCPEGCWWFGAQADAAAELFGEINSKFSTDLSRQYLAGISMGGDGTWYILKNYPDIISAAVPVAGASYGDEINDDGTLTIVGIGQKTLKVPIYYIYDTLDQYLSKRYNQSVVRALIDYGAENFTYRETTEYGHSICDRYVGAGNITVLEWLYSQRRDTSVPIEPEPPVFGK